MRGAILGSAWYRTGNAPIILPGGTEQGMVRLPILRLAVVAAMYCFSPAGQPAAIAQEGVVPSFPHGNDAWRQRSESVQSDTADVHWDARFLGPPGIDGGIVFAVARMGTDIYFGGSFWGASRIASRGIIRWNTVSKSWFDVGGGMNGTVYALAVRDSLLYAGGSFTAAGTTPVNNIAAWNGTMWLSVGTPPNDGITGGGKVNCLAVSDSVLYVGGSFTVVGNGIQADYVARWDGTAWSSLSSPLNNVVESMAVWDSVLYVGGAFQSDSPPYFNHIVRWDGRTWSTLGSYPAEGVDDDVLAMTVLGSSLYVGGTFTTRGRGADTAAGILRWNGSAWSAVGTGFRHGAVRAFAANGDSLYAGGSLDTCGAIRVAGIACWDTATGKWSALNKGIQTPRLVDALLFDRNLLYVAGVLGAITNVTEVPASNVATWDGSGWAPLGATSLNSVNYPFVITVSTAGSDLYVGGYFSLAGPVQANNIVRYTPESNTWTPLGTGTDNGVNGPVETIGISPAGDLYVGGNFTVAGGHPVHGIARWNGSAWAPLGTSPNDGVTGGIVPTVTAITFAGSSVYVGGTFDTVGGSGGIAASNIGLWDGVHWHSLGNGVDGTVNALKVYRNELIAGGTFVHAGGVVANHLARWNGTAWYSLGSASGPGLNDNVFALETNGQYLYAGGQFTQTGNGNPVVGVARWDGSSFASLGGGLVGTVMTLAATGSSLYAGGVVTNSGILALNNIGRWDTSTSTWYNLGSGIAGFQVNALTASANDVFAGGEFFQAGTKLAYCLAHWTPTLIGTAVPSGDRPPREFSLSQNFPNPFNPTTVISGRWTVTSDVSLVVYDVLGRRVATLATGRYPAGRYSFEFNATGLASGVYLCRLTAGHLAATKAMMLIR